MLRSVGAGGLFGQSGKRVRRPLEPGQAAGRASLVRAVWRPDRWCDWQRRGRSALKPTPRRSDMKKARLVAIGMVSVLVIPLSGAGQVSKDAPASITTPTKVESRIGTLEFKDGAPS